LHTLLKCYRQESNMVPSNVQIQKTEAEAGLYAEIYPRFLAGQFDVQEWRGVYPWPRKAG
jgi:hypothetical protein